MDYKIVKENKQVFNGIVREVSTVDGANFKEIPQMWKEVMSKNFNIMMDQADEIGVVGICYDWKQDTQSFKYMIGVRNKDAVIPNGETAEFESQTFAAFTSVGELPDALQSLIKKVYSDWLPTSGYVHSGGPEIEVYPGPVSDNPEEYVCYYWIPVKQKGE